MHTKPKDMTLLADALSVRSHAGPHCQNRLLEWCCCCIMIGIALCLYLSPRTLEAGSFRFMAQAGFTPTGTLQLMLICGLARMAALWLNGNWQPYGAWCRATGSVVGAVIWFQMAVALLLLSQITGTLSLGTPTYFVLTVGEILSCYRAAIDERRPRARF